jgi:hypothetical protein
MLKSLLYLLALLFVSSNITKAAPSLSSSQVLKFRDVILNDLKNKEYKEVYSKDKPKYDLKKKLWIFHNGFPRTPGGSSFVFEFRESDGHYRLGWVSSTGSSVSCDKFRIQPSLRRKIKVILEEIHSSK